MASYIQFLLLIIASTSLLISPAVSQSCRSQTFTQTNTTFTNCADLSSLRASLHWTYDPTARPNPTLTIAFIAPPARPAGWVAWALNPTATGMVGAQSLIAFRDTNGSVVVRTYNITSYSGINESRISYEVISRRGEYSGGVFRIFATVALPAGSSEVNQVWQVGAAVTNGVPARHDFAPENLSSRGVLRLRSAAGGDGNRTTAPAPAPKSGGAAPTRRPGGNDRSGSERVLGRLYGVLVILAVFVFGFLDDGWW